MSMAQGGSWYTYAYVYDGLGQIVGLIDETPGSATLGQEVATYTYDAWGNLLSHTDTSGTGVATSNPFLYKGYWYDWSTGLYDLNARYYNPALGRFLSVDPVGAQVGSGAPGYNGYAYASNNPVNRVDPTGKFANNQQDEAPSSNAAEIVRLWQLQGDVKAGKMFTSTSETNSEIAKQLADEFGGIVKPAKGKGWVVTIPGPGRSKSIVLRVMDEGGQPPFRRYNYWRISTLKEGAYTLLGVPSNESDITHFSIAETAWIEMQKLVKILSGGK